LWRSGQVCSLRCGVLAEQSQDTPFALCRQRKGVDAQLLPGLQGKQVCAFLVEIGQGQFASAGFQCVDEIFSKIETGLKDRRVRTESRRTGTERCNRRIDRCNRGIDVSVAGKVIAGSRNIEARCRRGLINTVNRENTCAIFIKVDDKVVRSSLNQIDTAEAGVIGE